MIMTLTEFLFQLALLLISFAVPVATVFVVSFLQTKIGNENLKKYLSYAETAVKAAETIYNSKGQGVVKKADVEKYLSDKIGGKLTAEDIDKLIQAAVYEINKTGKNLIFDTPTQPVLTPFVQPVNPFNPVTYTTTTTAPTTDYSVNAIKDVAAPDIPSPAPTGTVADPTTQAEYEQAVKDSTVPDGQ